MKKITLIQAKAVAIESIAKALGMNISSNSVIDAPLYGQVEALQTLNERLLKGLDKLIDEKARDSLVEHVHSGYQSQIDNLHKQMREQKEAHENELKELLDRVEAYQ